MLYSLEPDEPAPDVGSGQASDLDGADALLDSLQAPTLIADKGYDADERVLSKLERQK